MLFSVRAHGAPSSIARASAMMLLSVDKKAPSSLLTRRTLKGGEGAVFQTLHQCQGHLFAHLLWRQLFVQEKAGEPSS